MGGVNISFGLGAFPFAFGLGVREDIYPFVKSTNHYMYLYPTFT